MLEETVGAPARAQTRSQNDDRWYAPDRDLAYVGPELIRRALLKIDLDQVCSEAPFAGLLLRYSVADIEHYFGEAAKQLALGVNACWKADAAGPEVAFGGFCAVPAEVRVVIMAKLGAMLLGAIYTSLQDVTPVDGSPPHHRSLQSLLAAAEEFAKRAEVSCGSERTVREEAS